MNLPLLELPPPGAATPEAPGAGEAQAPPAVFQAALGDLIGQEELPPEETEAEAEAQQATLAALAAALVATAAPTATPTAPVEGGVPEAPPPPGGAVAGRELAAPNETELQASVERIRPGALLGAASPDTAAGSTPEDVEAPVLAARVPVAPVEARRSVENGFAAAPSPSPAAPPEGLAPRPAERPAPAPAPAAPAESDPALAHPDAPRASARPAPRAETAAAAPTSPSAERTAEPAALERAPASEPSLRASAAPPVEAVRAEPGAPPTEPTPLPAAAGAEATQPNAAARSEAPARTGPAQLPAAPEEIPLRVEWLAQRGGGTARVDLHPPHLGRIELAVRLRGQNVEVAIVAHESAAQTLVAGQRDPLADALAARDLRMTQFEVSDAGADGMRGDSGGERRPAAEPDEPRSPSAETTLPASAARGVRSASSNAVDLRV